MAINYNTHLSSLLSRIVFRRCSCWLYSTKTTKTQVAEENDLSEIVIPYRIQRSSTDILKALQLTLKKDYTAPRYKYTDDPYFIPVSNITKRSFALSKEAGKKAARFFLEKYPEIFICNKSDPLIKAFEPPVQYTENDEVTEEILLSCIESFDVANCITVYELLTKKDVTLKSETQQKLLEVLCFYNSTVPPRNEYYEERWYARKDERTTTNTWLSNSHAEKLFQEMEKNSSSYCTMIQGTAKYCCSEKAFLLFNEMQEKNLPATLETYNSLLNMVPRIKEDGDLRWEYAMDLVHRMNSEALKPNLFTMNALLNIVAVSVRWNKCRSIALQVIAEMERLNIEPSLGTYYYLLVIFYRNNRGFTSVLSQILSKLDGKVLELRHPADVLFFHTAMEVCCKVERDKDLAYRLNAFLELGTNHKFLASAFYESLYFQTFMRLLSSTEEFDKFMQIYERYVPNAYTPEPSITLDIIISLDFNGAYKHLTKLCSDVILFEQTEREDVLTELLRVSGSVKLENQDQELLVRLTWSIIEKIDRRAQNRMRKTLQWTGALFGNVLKICLNGNDLEKSWIIMQRLKNEEFSIVGLPDDECLTEFCKRFLEAKEFEKVGYCVRYAKYAINNDMKPIVATTMEGLMEKNLLTKADREEMNKILELEPEEDMNKENVSEQECTETVTSEEVKEDMNIENGETEIFAPKIDINGEQNHTVIAPNEDKR